MVIECKHCGAPLDVHEGDTLARCSYCGTTQRVRTCRTQIPVTPPDWRPPPQWTPPAQFKARSVPLQFDAGKTVRKLVLIIVAFAVITGLIPIACTVMAIIGAAASSSSGGSRKPTRTKPASGAKKPGGDSSVGLTKECQQAKACCLIAMADQDTTTCDQVTMLNDPKVCSQSLDAFRQLAQTKGKSCR